MPTSGNIGIGTDISTNKFPIFKLDVNGTFRTTGAAAIALPACSNIPSGVKLAVGGKILCEEVEVRLGGSTCWQDAVFDSTYKLIPLDTLEKFIRENKHLPNMPSGEDLARNGLNMKEMLSMQMARIEELTLYVIQLKKDNEELKKSIAGK